MVSAHTGWRHTTDEIPYDVIGGRYWWICGDWFYHLEIRVLIGDSFYFNFQKIQPSHSTKIPLQFFTKISPKFFTKISPKFHPSFSRFLRKTSILVTKILTKPHPKYFRFGFIFYPCLRISSTTWFTLYVPSICIWYITIYIYYLVHDRAQTLCRLWYVIFKWEFYRRTQVCPGQMDRPWVQYFPKHSLQT